MQLSVLSISLLTSYLVKGRIASKEVTLQLIQSKSVHLLLRGLETWPLNKSQLNSPDFVINRFFMKLFEMSDKI